MKTRIKIKIQTPATREEAEAVMNELALAENNKRTLAAKLDREILAAQERVAPALARCDEVVREKSAALKAWAEANPQLFAKRKSVDLLAGTLGFRTGTPKLALLSRAWNWDTVTEAVGHFLPNFIRSKPEVDKEAILAQREEEAIKFILPKCGLKVTQGESFFVEPNLTEAGAA